MSKNDKAGRRNGIDNCDMQEGVEITPTSATLYCPRSQEGQTRVVTGTSNRSTVIIKKLRKVAALSVCGGCSYAGLSRAAGEQVRAQELTAQAERVTAETALMQATTDQALARAEIARRLAAAGIADAIVAQEPLSLERTQQPLPQANESPPPQN